MKHFLLFLLTVILGNGLFAQQADSVLLAKDSGTVEVIPQQVVAPLTKILQGNTYLNSTGTPESLAIKLKSKPAQDGLFYVLAALILFFGIVRTIYSRYFFTLFRVFFNTSLRQSQLTDQLLQSTLPSLFYNLIFFIAAGIYAYLLARNLRTEQQAVDWIMLTFFVAVFFIIYAAKYLTLKFTGWVTGYKSEADSYIFIVFLINKIIGICLLPVTVILAFSLPAVINIFVIASLLFIGIMTFMRFLRSYSYLQHKLKVSRFHFFLYIFALEILPLIIIYKVAEVFIVKNL